MRGVGSRQSLIQAGLLIGLLFNPEDGGNMLVRNAS
jgi:hypothetical protein